MYRIMTVEDYDKVFALWKSIKGFSMRSLDDSREGVAAYLRRNPHTSVVCEQDGRIIGAILGGHDGRRGYLYHVCVAEGERRRGIGRGMVEFCLAALKKEGIKKVSLITFTKNDTGNVFWRRERWTKRDDLFFYDFTLDHDNVVQINAE